MSLTDWVMVSTVSYVPVVVSVTTCVCWYAALIVITPPFFLQVALVAGPPVEVQVRDLVVPLYTSVVAVGAPAKYDFNSCSKFFSCGVHRYIQVGEYMLSPQVQTM